MNAARETRFWAKVSPPDANGCWLWTAKTVKGGYGYFSAGRGLAHRLSWALTKGPIPAGALVLHSCDVPGCVNPDHLFIGTQKDNQADCAAKGRRDSPEAVALSSARAKARWQDPVFRERVVARMHEQRRAAA